jgi:CMP-N,N'-diacetyllegionaminic acid synthase
MKTIAIIPARSGSKGLKDKNIKLLNGKPLIAYTIEAAIMSGMFDEVFVSTDSERYAEIAMEYGANVPFLRSEAQSSDITSSWDVVSEVLKRFRKLGNDFDIFALLQPTSPLRTSNDIVAAFKIMSKRQANAVVAVCEVDHSPLWCNSLPEDGSLCGFLDKELVTKSRQQLKTFFRINGALYIVNASYFNSANNIYEEKCYAYVMEKSKSIDIDDQIDFDIANMLLKNL